MQSLFGKKSFDSNLDGQSPLVFEIRPNSRAPYHSATLALDYYMFLYIICCCSNNIVATDIFINVNGDEDFQLGNMQVTVQYLGKEARLELPDNSPVAEVLKKAKINPETVIVRRGEDIIHENERLSDNDKIQAIRIVSGG